MHIYIDVTGYCYYQPQDPLGHLVRIIWFPFLAFSVSVDIGVMGMVKMFDSANLVPYTITWTNNCQLGKYVHGVFGRWLFLRPLGQNEEIHPHDLEKLWQEPCLSKLHLIRVLFLHLGLFSTKQTMERKMNTHSKNSTLWWVDYIIIYDKH